MAPERLLDAAMDEDTGCSLCQRYDGNAQCPCGIAVIGGEDNDATSSMHAVLTMAQEALPAAIDGSSGSISDSDETTYVDSDDECIAMVHEQPVEEDDSGPEYAAFWQSSEDECTPSPPLKRAKTAALPGLSADSTTVPEHLVSRGRLVDKYGRTLMRSWFLGQRHSGNGEARHSAQSRGIAGVLGHTLVKCTI